MAFYAVKTGKKPGIYSTWSDCEEQVKGFKNSSFKKFDKKELAELYLNEVVGPSEEQETGDENQDELIASQKWDDDEDRFIKEIFDEGQQIDVDSDTKEANEEKNDSDDSICKKCAKKVDEKGTQM
eukprot:gene1693-1884_t